MRRLLPAALAAILLAAPALAQAPFTIVQGANDVPPTSAPPFAHWDLRKHAGCVVPYSLGNLTADIANAAVVTAQVDAAFAAWEGIVPALIGFSNRGNVAAGSAVDNQNVVFWDNALCSGDPWDAGLRGGAIGITAVRHSVVTGIMTDCDVVLDDEHFTWTAGTQNAPAVTGGDDFSAVQTLGDGSRRVVIATGANGICESRAVCGDVQVVAVGVNAGANQVCVRPAAAAVMPPAAATPLAGSRANLSGDMDIWTICAHEFGHFCGLGENNVNGARSSVNEGLTDGPYDVPAGATITFTVNGNLVNAALTQGAGRTAAQIAADINAAIGAQQPGTAAAAANPSGGVVITAANVNHPVVITGGTATGLFGLVVGESGISIMNQTDPRGLVSLDQRTPSRHDTDGLNFLYTPDLGDAPDQIFAGNPLGRYQTLVHTGTAIGGAAGMLNGVQLFQPGVGAVQQFGHAANRYEWLGANEDGNVVECEARISDQDQFDDGMSIPNNALKIGQPVRVTVLISTFSPPGAPARYFNGIAANMLYFNGYIDQDRDSRFDPEERLLHWSGVPGTTGAASANFVEMDSNLGANPMELAFDVCLEDSVSPDAVWARARLDYGEDEGRVAAGGTNGDLTPAQGLAQFGEVEDYPVFMEIPIIALNCPPPVSVTPDGNPVSVPRHFGLQNAGNTTAVFAWALTSSLDWPITVTSPPGAGMAGQVELGIGGTFDLDVTVEVPPDCEPGEVDSLCFRVSIVESKLDPDTCCTTVGCDGPVPLLVEGFLAEPASRSVVLTWRIPEGSDVTGVHVDRASGGGATWERLTASPVPVDRRDRYTFEDGGLRPDTEYRYRLGLLDRDGSVSEGPTIAAHTLPIPFAVGVPQPNPSRSGFALAVASPAEGRAAARVYDANGRLVRTVLDEFLPAGEYTIAWDGRRDDGGAAASGIYFIVFQAGGREATRRAVLIR